MSDIDRPVSQSGSCPGGEHETPEKDMAHQELDKLDGTVGPLTQYTFDEPNLEEDEEEPEGNNDSEHLNGDEALQGSDKQLGQEEPALHWNVEEDLEVQQWSDGSSYKGNVTMNMKLGFGEFKWANGESYTGEFYKDHHHGTGVYTWPDGSKFTGSFYLSRKEGYGTITFADGKKYQGLYKSDVRFGPGFETYSDGCQDVGIWLSHHLIRLCSAVPGSVSISSFPEFCYPFKEEQYNSENYASDLEKCQEEDPFEYRYKILLLEDRFTLPDRIYSYSSDMDHLPITPSLHTEFEHHFYRDKFYPEQSSNNISASMHCTNGMRKIYQHVNRHRNSPEHLNWDMCSIMNDDREKFGPKGIGESVAEQLIVMAGAGSYESISTILRLDLAHVDVSDSSGQTALHFATVNGHNKIINLLLDNGADVNKSNDEGLSALSLCLMLLYSTKSFWPNVAERNLPPNKEDISNRTSDSSGNESSVGDEKDIDDKNMMPPVSEQCAITSADDTTDPSVEGQGRDFTANRHRNETLYSTINLLLLRGADPNMCSIPMHALFFTTKAADVNTAQLLLECGARTDVRLYTQYGSLTPLHIAAALPLSDGIRITEILLHAASDPNASAEDEDYVYDQDRLEMPSSVLGFSMKGGHDSGLPLHDYFDKSPRVPEEGGRTPLHVACERQDNYKFAKDTISLLLAHSAKVNNLWSGHSPLSLAIASGNDLAVKELLANGADPNLALSRGVGSALCAAVNITYEKKRTLTARIALVDRLIKAGANILMPIVIGNGKRTVLGTATDYAYYKYFQDKRIAHTPYHALSLEERDIYNSRKQLLEHLGNLTREAAIMKEKEWAKEGIFRGPDVHRDAKTRRKMKEPVVEESLLLPQKTFFKYCYQCGRSVGVKLTPCLRCYCVYTCSKQCKKRSWEELHKDECQQLMGKLSGKMSATKGTRSQTSKTLHTERESSHHDLRAHTSRDSVSSTLKLDDETPTSKRTRKKASGSLHTETESSPPDLRAHTSLDCVPSAWNLSGKMSPVKITRDKISRSLHTEKESSQPDRWAHTSQDCVPSTSRSNSCNSTLYKHTTLHLGKVSDKMSPTKGTRRQPSKPLRPERESSQPDQTARTSRDYDPRNLSGKMSPVKITRNKISGSLHTEKESSHPDRWPHTSQDCVPSAWKVSDKMSPTKGTRSQPLKPLHPERESSQPDQTARTSRDYDPRNLSGKMSPVKITRNKISRSLHTEKESSHPDRWAHTSQDCVPSTSRRKVSDKMSPTKGTRRQPSKPLRPERESSQPDQTARTSRDYDPRKLSGKISPVKIIRNKISGSLHTEKESSQPDRWPHTSQDCVPSACESKNNSGKVSDKMSPTKGTRSQPLKPLHPERESSQPDQTARTSRDYDPRKLSGKMSPVKITRKNISGSLHTEKESSHPDRWAHTSQDCVPSTRKVSDKMSPTKGTRRQPSKPLRPKRESSQPVQRARTSRDYDPSPYENYSYN
ncbi:ankyrin repeat and MYND domain-containing protein 1 isoform X4 [Pseudophryne corroboree]|uniref:ankyrin repeat and MYND domain-containing protein 1 isoform X4 n=1 Tax=Pseudophryne corroboree TaxID=495146 RepID=UPI003081760E